MEKNDQVAIVTGASGGIGRAVALRLAHDGFAVVLNYAGNAAKAEEAEAEIKAAGGRAIAVRADVASVADVERLFKEAGRVRRHQCRGELRGHHAAENNRRWRRRDV